MHCIWFFLFRLCVALVHKWLVVTHVYLHMGFSCLFGIATVTKSFRQYFVAYTMGKFYETYWVNKPAPDILIS